MCCLSHTLATKMVIFHDEFHFEKSCYKIKQFPCLKNPIRSQKLSHRNNANQAPLIVHCFRNRFAYDQMVWRNLMLQLFSKLSTFIFIIFLGYACKRMKLFKREDAVMFGKISLYVTLPAALLSNADQVVLNIESLLLISIGILANLTVLTAGYLAAGKKDPVRQAGLMLNCGGYNIGNFSFPFVYLMFGTAGTSYLLLVDSGNAIVGLGLSYLIASAVANPHQKISWKFGLKKLFSSIPFDVYVLLLTLAAFHIKVPDFILSTASTIGGANSFVALFMIGLLLEFQMPMSEVKDAAKVILVRLLVNIALGTLVYGFFPIPELAKKIVMIALLSPVPSVVPIYASMIGYDRPLTAITSTVTAMESIVLFSAISLL